MSRTRAERRHNTFKKTSSRKAKAYSTGFCGGKLTPNGEIKVCSMCERCKPYDHKDRLIFDTKKLTSFILAQD